MGLFEDLLRGAANTASRAFDQANPWDGGKDWNQRTARPAPRQQQRRPQQQQRQVQLSPQAQQRIRRNEEMVRQSQANIMSPMAILDDIVKSGQQAMQVGKDLTTGAINDAGNLVANAGERGAETIREFTGQNQKAYEETQRRAAEYRRMAQSFAQRAQQERDPARRQVFIDQIRSLGAAEDEELARANTDIQRGMEALDPRKTLVDSGMAVLDIATAGKGKMILEGLQTAATPVTKQVVGQLAKNTAITGAQTGALGAGYGGLETARDPNATIQDYARNMSTGAALGAGLGVGAQIAMPVVGQVAKQGAKAVQKGATTAMRKQEEAFLKNASAQSPLTTIRPEYINPSNKQLNPAIISQHKKAILNGNIEPLVVARDNTGYIDVLDGEHRLAAYKELGVETVPTKEVSMQQLRMMKQGGYAKVPGTQGTLGKEKLSKFANKTVQNSDEVSTPLKKLVKEEQSSYTTTTNEGRLDVSKQWLKGKSDDKAYTEVTKALENVGKSTDQDVVNAIETAKRLDSKGGDENLLKATEIYETLSRNLSKKGQEVQAASLLNNRTPQGLSYKVQKDLRKAGIELTPERLNTIKGHIDKIKKLTPGTDESNFARHELAKYVTSQIPAGTANKIINFWRAGLLTAPTTTGGNILGNTGEAVVRKGFVNPVATGVDKLISLKTGKRTMTLGGGFKEGAVEGKSKLGRFMKTGYDERNALSKYDAKELNYGDSGVGKLVGNYVNGTYRLMSVADQPYWYGARNEALSSIAKAEALNKGLKGTARKEFITDFKKNPPKAALERATQEAKYGTFQNETTLGTAAGGLKQSLRRRSDVAGAAADFFIPFTQVPSAIATRVVKRTPVGTAQEAVKQFVKIKKGGKFDQRAMSQAIAEGSFGPAVFAAGYALANSGQLTFGYPEDSKERELWEAEGKQPYSVRVGDRWYSMNYLQPFGTLLSVGGEAANAEKEGANPGETISRGIATAGQAVMNQSFLKGISGVLDAIDNPKQYAENYVSNTAGSVVPNFVRSFARASDPMQREQKGAVAGLQGSFPGLRQGLPEKLDMFGQSIEAKDNFLNQYINPLRPSKAREGDATVAELRRLKDIDEGVLPTAARKNTYGDLGKLTNKQVHELNSRAGKAMKAEYDKLIASDAYKSLDDATKARSLKNINSDVFGAVKHQYGIDQGFAMDTRKLTKDQQAYINGQTNSFLAKAKGSSSTEVAPNLAKDYKKTLEEFDALDTTAKEKKLYKENDAEYRYELAKYENKKASGTLSKADRIKAEDKLISLEIGSKFSKETRELYSLNKTQLTALIDNGEITEKQAEQIMALGDAYASAGKSNKFRDKYGNVAIRPKGKGSGGGRKKGSGKGKGKGGAGKGKIPASDDNSDTINLVASLSRKVANTKVAKRQLPTGGAIRAPGIKAYKKVAKTNVSMTRRT